MITFVFFLYVADIFLSHVVCNTVSNHMHSLCSNADEALERSEPGRTAAVGRESSGQKARYQDGRGRSRHFCILLVSNTGE